VENCTLLDRVDAVGRDVKGGGGGERLSASVQCSRVSRANLVTVQEAILIAKGPHSIIGCPGSYPMK
jgi:hypothetical protein